MRFTPEYVTKLAENEIFVFGSNRGGRHGKGAALVARENFGAVTGVGEGPTGQCYALPTKNSALRTLPLMQIGYYVEDFLEYAAKHSEKTFLVTKVGCGLAGYQPHVIGRLFFDFGPLPVNVVLPKEFHAPD